MYLYITRIQNIKQYLFWKVNELKTTWIKQRQSIKRSTRHKWFLKWKVITKRMFKKPQPTWNIERRLHCPAVYKPFSFLSYSGYRHLMVFQWLKVNEYTWRYNHRSCNSNKSPKKKNFRASTKICASAAVLYQLSYERPIHWKKVNLLSSPQAIFFPL